MMTNTAMVLVLFIVETMSSYSDDGVVQRCKYAVDLLLDRTKQFIATLVVSALGGSLIPSDHGSHRSNVL
jgi:hypothetical protein